MENPEERIDVYVEDVGENDPNAPLRHNFNSLIGLMKGANYYHEEPAKWRELLDYWIPPLEQLKQNIMWARIKEKPPVTLENLDKLLERLRAINPETKIPTRENIDELQKFFEDTFGKKGFFN